MAEGAVSTTLLKVVAEAASAYRMGTDVYVVACHDHPHDREVFSGADETGDPKREAQQFHEGLEDPDRWSIFGPYVTEPEEPGSRVTALDYKVTIESRGATATPFKQVFDGEVDAVFLTLPALDKFILPYYSRVLGIDRALEIRRPFIAHPTSHNHVWNSKFI